MPISVVDPRAPFRLHQLRQHLDGGSVVGPGVSSQLSTTQCKAADNTAVPDASKLCTAEEAAALIPDGVFLTPSGFVGTSCPELLLNAVRKRFDATGHPRSLGLIFAASSGNSKGRGCDQLAVEGLVDRLVYGWTGTAPGFLRLVRENKVQAWNLPLGVVSHIIRDVAARRPGPITHVGLGTFVDPREKGGKLNSCTTRDMVHLLRLGSRELLWYEAPREISVALLRGTTADLDGNVSFEREALLTDQLNQAMAAHNSGGLVVVQARSGGGVGRALGGMLGLRLKLPAGRPRAPPGQRACAAPTCAFQQGAHGRGGLPAPRCVQVERVVDRGTLHPKAVHLPGALVDRVVVAPPELHWQSFREAAYDGSLSGEVRSPLHSIPALPLDERRIIAHRAMLEIDRPNCIVNLGVGMPEGVAVMVATHGAAQNPHAASVTLSTEAGAFGGIPGGGLRFGSSHNPACLIPTASMIDFYNGSGVDIACLGLAEADPAGNVNVSNFGAGRMPGCGGFIDISQTARKVCFLGTFTSGGLKVAVEAGQLVIKQEGRLQKFRRAVHEKTFAGASANGRTVLFITERAVFRITHQQEGGADAATLELVEVAPGMNIERDILAHMEFKPLIRSVKPMPAAIFAV